MYRDKADITEMKNSGDVCFYFDYLELCILPMNLETTATKIKKTTLNLKCPITTLAV